MIDEGMDAGCRYLVERKGGGRMGASTHPGSRMEPRAWILLAIWSSLTLPQYTYVSRQLSLDPQAECW